MDNHNLELDWIDTQEKTLLDRVRQWVAVNTFSSNIEGLAKLLLILEKSFTILGGESSRISLPEREIFSPEGLYKKQPLGEALAIRKRPQAPIQILLGGHYDTVFDPSAPFQSLEEQKPGIWRGPGAADMKGGLAILLTALEAVERSPLAHRIGWEVLITPDEEIGSPGSAPLYRAAAKQHQLGLIFEPSFPDGSFVNERKGSASYTVVAKGKAAHVGRDFDKGRSAVFPLARLIHQLEAFPHQNEMTINVAELEGKGPLNIVPPLASCRINIRSSKTKLFDEFLAGLNQFVNENQGDGIEILAVQDSFRSPKLFDVKTQQLFEAWGRCATDLGLPFRYQPSGGICDGNILASEGLPTLDTAGVVGGGLHTFDEYFLLSSLVERSKLAALFLLRLASQEITLPPKAPHGS